MQVRVQGRRGWRSLSAREKQERLAALRQQQQRQIERDARQLGTAAARRT